MIGAPLAVAMQIQAKDRAVPNDRRAVESVVIMSVTSKRLARSAGDVRRSVDGTTPIDPKRATLFVLPSLCKYFVQNQEFFSTFSPRHCEAHSVLTPV